MASTTGKNTVVKPTDQPTDEPANQPTKTPDYNKHKTETKLNIPSLAHVRVGGVFPENSFFDKSLDECYAELKSNQLWSETVTMNTRSSGYKDFMLDDFFRYLEMFFKKLQNEGETVKSTKDAMSHFARWLSGELKKECKNEKSTSTNRPAYPSAAERIREESARHIQGIAARFSSGATLPDEGEPDVF